MSSPVVSVAMSVYNAEPYLAKAIASILNQTFRDFEFIIIDDGSTDRSLKTLQKYAAQDQRIRLTSRENRGIPQTRNEILAQAQGEFIAVMDADDIALPDRFERQVEFLNQHPNVICVGGAFDLIDEQGHYLTLITVPTDDATIQKMALVGHCSICHPTAMIRRSALLQVFGYDEAFRQTLDLDLWLRLGEIGQLANLEQSVLRYRLHTRSVSGQRREEQRQSGRLACERAWQRRGIEGHFEASEPWRPGPDRASQHQYLLKYGWWAFNSRQRQTAIIYGLKAIQKIPWAIAGWKLLISALIKLLPKR